MNKFLIKTSNQGYDLKAYNVETTASLDQIKEIDFKYGAQYRSQSTDINQLQRGALEEGFEFTYKPFDIRDIKTDYFCQSGNY